MIKIMFLLAIMYVMPCFAHTADECFQMVKEMIYNLHTSTDWNDCIEDENSTDPIPIQYPTALSLFEDLTNNTPFASWTLSERQEAFNSFLIGIAHTNRSLVSSEYKRMGDFALMFCQEKKYTNALSSIKAIVHAPLPPCKDVALETFVMIDRPSFENNSLVLTSIVDRVGFSRDARRSALLGYVKKFGMIVPYNDPIATNAACLFYFNRNRISNLISIDKLLLAVYPVYSSSTNRFLLSRSALEKLTLNERERAYFVSVTNELHSAAQPLAVVPGL